LIKERKVNSENISNEWVAYMILVELKGRLYMYSGVAGAVVSSKEGLMGHVRRHGQHEHFSNMSHEEIKRLRKDKKSRGYCHYLYQLTTAPGTTRNTMEILRLKATPHDPALQLLMGSAMTTFEDTLILNFHTLEDPGISMKLLLGRYRRFNPASMFSQEQYGRTIWGLFTLLRLLTVDYKKDRSIKGFNRAAPSTQGFHRGPSGFITTGELYECLDKHYEKTRQTYLTVDDVAAIQEALKLKQLSRRRAKSLYKLVLGQYGQTGLKYRERDFARRLRVILCYITMAHGEETGCIRRQQVLLLWNSRDRLHPTKPRHRSSCFSLLFRPKQQDVSHQETDEQLKHHDCAVNSSGQILPRNHFSRMRLRSRRV
jgi:hypothetical protein